MYKNRCEGGGEGGEEGEEGKDRNEFVKNRLFLMIEKIVYTTKKSNFQIKDTDRMEIPRILTIQNI